MRIDRSRFHALAVAMAGCGGAAAPPAAPENVEGPAGTGVVCAKQNDEGECARWSPDRQPEPICVGFLPSGACHEEQMRRVAPVDGEYLEPTNECIDWTENGACTRTQSRYPVTVDTCADWTDELGCLSWEPTDPAPAEERGWP